jgi:aminopeptidase N
VKLAATMPVEHRLHARCGCAAAGSQEQQGGLGRPFTLATSTRHFERDRPFSVQHLRLDVTLDVAQKSIVARTTLDVRRVDPSAEAIALDAVGFTIDRVSVDGHEAEWRYDGQLLTVSLRADHQAARIDVDYRATPRRGLYFLEPDEHYPDRPRQVWSQCQEEDARHFVVCHDSPHAKMTTEVIARVPRGWYALSNGALVSTDEPERGPHVYHWKMDEPHSSYLLTLVAGEFTEIADGVVLLGREVPVTYLVPRGREEDGRRAFGRTPEMIRHFSEVTGVPYPWNKYAQVVVSDFIFGGMENTTATTMYEHVLLDERAAIDVTSDDIVAHELAHQWFGDYVTCRAWYEAWLNEGFATFFEHVWREKDLGADEYAYGIKGDLAAYASEAHGRYRRSVVCQDYDAPLDLFDRHLYEKGALVLHSLRVELGDTLFWRGVKRYLDGHAGGIVETRDLQRAMEEVSGRSLGRFFEQAVYRAGHPEVEVHIGWDRGVLTVGARQTQSTSDGVPACFELTLDLDVVDSSGNVTRRSVTMTERHQSFALSAPTRPAFVVVDPAARILGEVRVKAPGDMLREQLSKAPTGRGRWIAAQALARTDDPATIEALGRVLVDEGTFWGTRAECAAALGRLRARESFEVLVGAVPTAHPKVRRAVVEALGHFRTDEAALAIQPLALRDPSYLVEAEAARALGQTRQARALATLVEMLDRPSWFEVVRAGALDGLAALRDETALTHLTAWTRYGRPPRVRRSAVIATPKLAVDKKAREGLEELLDDRDPLLRLDVARALGDLGDPKSRGPLRERLEADHDPRVRRRIRETLRDLAEPKRVAESLRDELDKLQGEHTELRSRLSKLEARLEAERAPAEGAAGQPPAAKAAAEGGKTVKKAKKSKKKKKGKRR